MTIDTLRFTVRGDTYQQLVERSQEVIDEFGLIGIEDRTFDIQRDEQTVRGAAGESLGTFAGGFTADVTVRFF